MMKPHLTRHLGVVFYHDLEDAVDEAQVSIEEEENVCAGCLVTPHMFNFSR